MDISNPCAQLLQQGQQFHPLYGDRLANHLPMALIALDRLGATPQQLTAFYENYRAKLLPLDSQPHQATITSIDQALGQSERLWDYIDFFTDGITHAGLEQTLRSALPVLLPGLSASAFHAMILLAYLSTGLSYVTQVPDQSVTLDWASIKRKACTSSNDHVIKLVYSCWREYQRNAELIYQAIAQNTVT